MTIPEILRELGPYTRKFPKEALQAAIDQREAITPELLHGLEAIANNPAEFTQRGDNMFPVFALYLLAQFREKRAYPLIVRMVNGPGDTAHELIGDTVTDGLHQILASVYDGDPTLLHRLIENEEAEEFVRDAAIRAILILERAGQMSRAEIVDYFRSLFHGKLQREHSFVWDGLVCAVGDLPAPELLEEVKRAYEENVADKKVAGFEQIERDATRPKSLDREEPGLVTDAIGEMENWVCCGSEEPFAVEPPKGPELPEAQVLAEPPPPPTPYVPPKPFVREPKIGRNEPCPCGSGKKYKKCCGKS